MALSPALRTVVTRLTAKLGDRVILRHNAPGKFQTSTLTMPTTRKEWPDVPAAVTEVKFTTPDGRMQVGDRRLLLSAGSIVPEDFPTGAWDVVVRGAVYHVLTANPIEVEGKVVMWDVVSRAGAR